MKRSIIVLILFGISALLSIVFLPIFPFVPLELNEGERNVFVKSVSPLDTDRIKNLAMILDHYGERHCVCGQNVRVCLRLFLDKDLMWNYTTKANDPKFVEDIKTASNRQPTTEPPPPTNPPADGKR